MLDFAFRFIILCCKVEHHFAFKFHAVQFYAAIQHDSWRFILKAFDRNLTGSPNCMTMQVLSVREKTDISQCLEKPAQLNLSKHYRKQAYSVGASTGRPGRLKFCGANSNIVNACVRCGYKLYWIQTFYFHDKQFRSSLNVHKTLESILLFISHSSSRAFKQLFLWYCRSRYALGFKLQKLKIPQNSLSYNKEVLRWICSDWFLIGNGH